MHTPLSDVYTMPQVYWMPNQNVVANTHFPILKQYDVPSHTGLGMYFTYCCLRTNQNVSLRDSWDRSTRLKVKATAYDGNIQAHEPPPS